MFVDRVNLKRKQEVLELEGFLKEKGIDYELPSESYIIRQEGKIVATGSLDGKVLKYFFLDEKYQGQGLMAKIYNAILDDLFRDGVTNHFVFTGVKNKNIFTSLGLSEVASTDNVILLEGGMSSYPKWINDIKIQLNPEAKKRGAIVMNANPMTLGHKYLVDQSLEKVDELILFVVEEDLSIFPFEARFKIVSETFKDNPKVKVVPSGEYIISQSTFPTYFLKKEDDMLIEYTKLDTTVFAKRIAHDLSINYRFVGEEPTDLVTNQYNNALGKILQDYGVKLTVIPRKELDQHVISASRVRKLISEDNEQYQEYIVPASIEFLNSPAGQEIIKIIKESK